jgi:hypothetical protein
MSHERMSGRNILQTILEEMMNKTILLTGCFLLAFLALAGCAAVASPTSTPMPAPPAPQGGVALDDGGGGLEMVKLEMSHAPRPNETVVLTLAVTPYWPDPSFERLSITMVTMTTWIEIPPDLIVEEIPPGMVWILPENATWNCHGCIGVLQATEVLHLGENRQYAMPVRFTAEGGGWGGYTSITAAVNTFIIESITRSDMTTLELTITKDFSHFGAPEGFWEAPRLGVPGPDSPPTTAPALIQEAVVTPDLSASPPAITPVPATPYEPGGYR